MNKTNLICANSKFIHVHHDGHVHNVHVHLQHLQCFQQPAPATR